MIIISTTARYQSPFIYQKAIYRILNVVTFMVISYVNKLNLSERILSAKIKGSIIAIATEEA